MIGIDIEEVARFENKTDEFYKRIFTLDEIKYAEKFDKKAERFAGMFCAKEAVMKAISVQIEKMSFQDIEITHAQNGKPVVVLKNLVKEIFESINAKSVEISVSHTSKTAVAICFINQSC